MFKSFRLKKQLRIVKELKLQDVKNQNFESAALHRQKEMEMLQQLQSTCKGKLFKAVKSLLYKHLSELLCGIYIQKQETDLPIYLPFYYFSRELNHYLECFFAEHPAFRYDWNEQPHRRRSMLKEITEYYLITEVLDHFSRWHCDSIENNCKHELTRKDIEEFLESNVFLKLFTMPIEYRKVFSDYLGKDLKHLTPRDEKGNPVGYYQNFHYKLPYKLKLERESGDYIITTPFIILRFHVGFGSEERLPKEFGSLFLGYEKVKVPNINLYMDAYIRWPVFIVPKYWKYVSTFRNLNQRLRESFSSDYYFKKIN